MPAQPKKVCRSEFIVPGPDIGGVDFDFESAFSGCNLYYQVDRISNSCIPCNDCKWVDALKFLMSCA